MEKTWQYTIDKLSNLHPTDLYNKDFFLTWEKSDDALETILLVADALRTLRTCGISAKVFDSGLAVSLFRDNSTRTRFSFASACNFLGLAVQDLDEKKSQIAHGESVRESANMISFMADIIGIRDDMYIGCGNAYMREVADALDAGYGAGVLEQRPTLVNLQCDIDHPTQTLADLLHLTHVFGDAAALKGKKIAMSWAYSPSYGKPLSVPQGIIGLMTRLGMDVVLAHPKGYEVMPDVLDVARKNAAASGGSFAVTNDMTEAFTDADIVYPKSWAPFSAMEHRTKCYQEGDADGINAIEEELLKQNAAHTDWCCTEERMKHTRDGRALYMHCLPADITEDGKRKGEVETSIFERYRSDLYRQAGCKPYIIAAILLLERFRDPAALLSNLYEKKRPRKLP